MVCIGKQRKPAAPYLFRIYIKPAEGEQWEEIRSFSSEDRVVFVEDLPPTEYRIECQVGRALGFAKIQDIGGGMHGRSIVYFTYTIDVEQNYEKVTHGMMEGQENIGQK